jgi:glycosyl transferase family 25
MIKAHIINLDRNPDRLEFVASKLNSLGISFQRFPAIDAKKISDQELEVFAAARPNVRNLGIWTKGKMACNSGHRALWKVAAESPDNYTAIFEDDIRISDSLKDFLTSEDWIPEDCDIVRLEAATPLPILVSKTNKSKVGSRHLQKVIPNKYRQAWPVGTAAYIISKKAARLLLDTPLEEHIYTDHTLFNCYTSAIARRLNVYQVVPGCCIQDKFYHKDQKDIIFNSDIETVENVNMYKGQSNPVKQSMKKVAQVFGLLPAFRKSKEMLYAFKGYKRVGYSD